MGVCVYACVAFAYMQLVILVVALNVSSTPPGLVFLSLSLYFIGYVVFKVSFIFVTILSIINFELGDGINAGR